MYEELIKRLKDRAERFDSEGWVDITIVLEQAADAIEELQQTVEHYKGCADDWYREACDCKAMIPHWISVAERLPEENVAVLTWGEQAVVLIDWHRNGEWFVADGVTHWMPLPKPPKEET